MFALTIFGYLIMSIVMKLGRQCIINCLTPSMQISAHN